MMKVRLLAVLLFVALLCGCKKLVDAPAEKCFIPYLDFVAYNINPNTLEVSFTSITSFNGTIRNHKWDFGDGTSFNGPAPPPHKYPSQTGPSAGGTYRVRYSVANECGEAQWTKEVSVSPCVAKVGFQYTVVNDSTIRFKNTSTSGSPVTFEWTFGDGTQSNASTSEFSKVYQFDGNYVVTLKASNACGDNYFIDTIPVCKKPVPAQQVEVGDCGSVSINAGATQNGALYQWDFGDGTVLPATPSTNPVINYTYTASGSFNIRLKVINKNYCDSVFLNTPVNIRSSNLGKERAWSYTSDDLSFRFRRAAVTNATQYRWEFGDGSASNEKDPDKVYETPGVYNLRIIAANACRADTIEATINVPQFKAVGNAPNTGLRDVVALGPRDIYVLGTNGALYKTDTAGNWSGPIGLPGGLSFNGDTQLFQDINGQLWVYGRGEVARFNPAGRTWTSFFDRTDWKNNTTIEGMAVDAEGNLWTIAGKDVRRNSTELRVPGNNNFSAIAFAPGTRRVWLTAVNRSFLYSAGLADRELSVLSSAGLGNGGNGPLLVAPNGYLLIGTSQGLVATNSVGVRVVEYNSLSTGGLLNGKPDSYSIDSEGNIWAVQGGRLIRIPVSQPGAARNYSFHPTLNSLGRVAVLSLGNGNNDLILTKTNSNAVIHMQ